MNQVNFVWSIKGMEMWARMISDALKWPLVVNAPVGDCDTVWVVGGYDAPTFEYTLGMTARARQRIWSWHSGDLVAMKALGGIENLPGNVKFVADSDVLKEELLELGIEVAGVTTMPTKYHVPICPLPDKPRMVVYYGNNPDAYGKEQVRYISDQIPELDVRVVPYDQSKLLTDADYERLIRESTFIFRIRPHDGGAASCREWMEAGRFAVTNVPLKFAHRVSPDDPVGILTTIRQLMKRTEPDSEAAAFYSEFNTKDAFLGRVKEAFPDA